MHLVLWSNGSLEQKRKAAEAAFFQLIDNKQLTAYSQFQNPRLQAKVLVCTCCFYFCAPTREAE
jgi:hypothetical protein